MSKDNKKITVTVTFSAEDAESVGTIMALDPNLSSVIQALDEWDKHPNDSPTMFRGNVPLAMLCMYGLRAIGALIETPQYNDVVVKKLLARGIVQPDDLAEVVYDATQKSKL